MINSSLTSFSKYPHNTGWQCLNISRSAVVYRDGSFKCRILGKRQEKKKERGRKKEKRNTAVVSPLVFMMTKDNCYTEKIHLAVTFSIIRIDMQIDLFRL